MNKYMCGRLHLKNSIASTNHSGIKWFSAMQVDSIFQVIIILS